MQRVHAVFALLGAIFILLIAPFPASCAEPSDLEGFSLVLIPGMTLPVGEDTSYFTLGGGAALFGRLTIPNMQFMYFETGFDFSMSPIKVAADKSYPGAMLNVLSGSLGMGLRYQIFPRFYAGIYGHGGYYYGFASANVSGSTANNPFFDAGVELKYRSTPYLNLGVDVSYRQLLGLLSDIRTGLGVSYNFPVRSREATPGSQSRPNPQIELLKASADEDLSIFPVFYSYYADHPFGRIEIRNKGKIPLEKVSVKVFVNQYMDNPYMCKEIPFITGGGKEAVELTALFNNKVLEITESTKVQLSITVDSQLAGESYGNELIQNLRVYDRNAMTWENDARAAAFVSLKDPSVLKFSKNVSSYVKDKASKAINKNLLLGMAFFESLRLYGMSYAVDPTTPFVEFSKKKTAVDFLQFPNHTLDYKAGDCDDLSILYCALLESVGIRSAFLTVPGHIFAALSLDMTPAEARRQFSGADELVYTEDNAWFPVEITGLGGGFLEAWQSGAKLWREQKQAGQAQMTILQEAWKSYPPVGAGGDTTTISPPSEDRVVSAYLKEVMRYIDRELFPKAQQLDQQISKEPRNAALINKLGVLYARYGVYDKAEAAFQRASRIQETAPVLMNIGNLKYIAGNLEEARRYYEKAMAKAPSNGGVLLSLAKICFEMGKYDTSDSYYERLKREDPKMAERYPYTAMKEAGDAARAANTDAMKEVMIWGE